MNQLLLDIAPDWQPTLDNFMPGSNLELLSVLRNALADHSGERCFYVWGDEGCGKSHLLQACSHLAPGSVYVQGSVPQPAKMVAVDDVERLDDAAQIELFNLYNRMRDQGSMLLVSGTQSPPHLVLREDLRTRLAWGLVYQVHGLNDTDKAQALAQHASAKGYRLPPEVAQYLLRHGRRDLPNLMASLDALDCLSLRLHRAPSVPLLKEILHNESESK